MTEAVIQMNKTSNFEMNNNPLVNHPNWESYTLLHFALFRPLSSSPNLRRLCFVEERNWFINLSRTNLCYDDDDDLRTLTFSINARICNATAFVRNNGMNDSFNC